jgi:hypothetical protein
VLDRAVFVLATPFGLTPAPAVEEPLGAEVYEAGQAVGILRQARQLLIDARRTTPVALEQLVDEIPTNFQDRCIGTCILTSWCERNRAGSAAVLGDAAADVFGPNTSVARIIQLTGGAPPQTAREAELQRLLADAARVLGQQPGVAMP